MNFLSVLYAKAGITVDGVTTLNNTATALTPATNDNSTKIATTAFVKNQNYYPYPTGTTAQYVRGDGSLATLPSIAAEAQRLITEVYNETGATLTKGTVVYINGGHGNLPTITKALATSDATSAQTYGVVQNDITDNNNGFVVVIGSITDIPTNTYLNGTILYLSPITAGEWTSTKPYAPQHIVYVGIVTRSHPTQGVVEVRVQNGYEMDELHNVSAQSPANGDILQFNFSTQLWTKTTGNTTAIAEGTNLYFTDARARAAISLTTIGTSGAATYSGGVLNIPQYQAALTNPITGTGTTNYLPKFTGTSALGDSILLQGTNNSLNNVFSSATGTQSFAGMFTGQGASGNTGVMFFGAGEPNGIDPSYPNIRAGLKVYQSWNGSSTDVKFDLFTLQGGIGGNIVLTGLPNGNAYLPNSVGIGTTSPAAKLDIKGGNAGTLKLDNDNSQYVQLLFEKGSAANSGADFLLDGTGGSFGLRTLAAIPITFSTSASAGAPAERMRITSAGNVGIGSTNPAYKLDVSGEANLRDYLLIGNSQSYFGDNGVIENGTADGNTRIQYFNTKYLAFKESGNERMRIASGGNVGIGSTNPLSQLQVGAVGTTADTAITIGSTTTSTGNLFFGDGSGANQFRGYLQYDHNVDALNFGTSAAERMRIFSDGNIAINSTTNAGYKLDVNGTARVNGSFYIANTNANNELTFAGSQFTNIFSETTSGIQFGITSTGNTAAIEFLTNNTTKLTIASTGAATFASSVTATNFIGAGTGLTGTASALSIGGNAATATSATTAGTSTYASILTTTNQGIVGGNGLTTVSSEAQWSNFPIGYSAMFLSNQVATGAPSATYGFFIKIANRDAGGGWGGIWTDYSGGDTYVGNTTVGTSYANWYKLLSSSNYNSYAPTLTGTGASGTWGINITGNANYATTAGALTSMNISQFTNDAGYITSTSSTFSYTASVTLSPTWQNTGVSSANLTGSGVYIVTCNANDFGVSGGQYNCTYTGIMYWFAGGTNGSNVNEIVLHHTGHADNGRYIYLRTINTVSADGKTYLQISGNGTNSGASNYQLTFKKIL